LDNSISPALVFDPVPPGVTLATKKKAPAIREKLPLMARPGSLEELAFKSVAQLSELVRTRKVKPSELTEMYLMRLKRYDPQLRCVISLTEERALAQAKAADAEIASGKYRGPLHGIPWGAKDLLAVKGYKTTWGAGPYKDQTIDSDATVVTRLDQAGSISSPSTRCGVTGLRPTFGRVPRTGAMALAWSMDKIGPIGRSVEDTALVLNAIHGPD